MLSGGDDGDLGLAFGEGAAQRGQVLEGVGVVDAGEDHLAAAAGPDGVGLVGAVGVPQLGHRVDDDGEERAVPGAVGELLGQGGNPDVRDLVQGEEHAG